MTTTVTISEGKNVVINPNQKKILLHYESRDDIKILASENATDILGEGSVVTVAGGERYTDILKKTLTVGDSSVVFDSVANNNAQLVISYMRCQTTDESTDRVEFVDIYTGVNLSEVLGESSGVDTVICDMGANSVVTSTITVNNTLYLTSDNKSVLTYEDNNVFDGIMFNVTGGSLTIDGVTLDGNNAWTLDNTVDVETYNGLNNIVESNVIAPNIKRTTDMITVTGGSLTLKGGTVIQNVYSYFKYISENNNANYKYLVSAKNSTVNIYDVTITNTMGAGIRAYENSTVLLDGAQYIKNFAAGAVGGFIVLENSSTLTMTGNTLISDNVGAARGGIIGMTSNAKFTMSGGKIVNNITFSSCQVGAMVYMERGGDFTMNGGQISENIGQLAAIGARWTDNNKPDDGGTTIIELKKGIISGNATGASGWGNATLYVKSTNREDIPVTGQPEPTVLPTIYPDMEFYGDVVLGNESCDGFINNGTINGNVKLMTWNSKAKNKFINNGTVTGNVEIQSGVAPSSAAEVFTNNGTVGGNVNIAGPNTKCTNNGTITGNVNITASGATFTNYGTIGGDVNITDGAVFENHGTVNGTIK